MCDVSVICSFRGHRKRLVQAIFALIVDGLSFSVWQGYESVQVYAYSTRDEGAGMLQAYNCYFCVRQTRVDYIQLFPWSIDHNFYVTGQSGSVFIQCLIKKHTIPEST